MSKQRNGKIDKNEKLPLDFESTESREFLSLGLTDLDKYLRFNNLMLKIKNEKEKQ